MESKWNIFSKKEEIKLKKNEDENENFLSEVVTDKIALFSPTVKIRTHEF